MPQYTWQPNTGFFDTDLGCGVVIEKQSFRLYRKQHMRMLTYTLRDEHGKAHQRSQDKMLEQIKDGILIPI